MIHQRDIHYIQTTLISFPKTKNQQKLLYLYRSPTTEKRSRSSNLYTFETFIKWTSSHGTRTGTAQERARARSTQPRPTASFLRPGDDACGGDGPKARKKRSSDRQRRGVGRERWGEPVWRRESSWCDPRQPQRRTRRRATRKRRGRWRRRRGGGGRDTAEDWGKENRELNLWWFFCNGSLILIFGDFSFFKLRRWREMGSSVQCIYSGRKTGGGGPVWANVWEAMWWSVIGSILTVHFFKFFS